MNSKINIILHKAKYQLKPLGKALFYLYIAIVLLGCAGVLYGIFTMILKIAGVASTITTPWWECIILPIVSWYTVKQFTKEIFHLLGNDEREQPRVETVQKKRTAANSNIISFTPKIDENSP